mgnify:CR=1 FL=1
MAAVGRETGYNPPVIDPRTLVEAMSNPAFYPEPTTRVEVVQTHISYIFLTDRYAYKVKKAVDFGFLDYTTLERRRRLCHREIALNSRLSPEAYLGVVEIREKDGTLAIGGDGEVVEVAVKMVRLPEERMLRRVLERGEGGPDLVRQIARQLAAFHAAAFVSPELQALKGPDGVRFNCVENFQQTERYIGTLLTDEMFNFIRTSTELFLQRKQTLLARRLADGRIVDGHGDLHLDSICATDPVQIFDCIEFNERFRIQDTAEEMGFLAMDLEFAGYPELAQAVIEEYIAASGDRELADLLSFYKSYRAYVRAKIHSFQTDDAGIPEGRRVELAATASRYYELAARYATEFNPQMLLVTVGLTGSGKSTLARRLAARCALQVVSTDETRKNLLGIDPRERHYDAFDHGVYAPSITERTYAAMIDRAEALLLAGQSVILDGCFTKRAQRARAVALANRMQVPLLVLDCRCSEELIRERLERRAAKSKGVSDGRWEIYQKQLETFEPPVEIPPEQTVVLDRSRPVETLVEELLGRVPPQWFDPNDNGSSQQTSLGER